MIWTMSPVHVFSFANLKRPIEVALSYGLILLATYISINDCLMAFLKAISYVKDQVFLVYLILLCNRANSQPPYLLGYESVEFFCSVLLNKMTRQSQYEDDSRVQFCKKTGEWDRWVTICVLCFFEKGFVSAFVVFTSFRKLNFLPVVKTCFLLSFLHF